MKILDASVKLFRSYMNPFAGPWPPDLVLGIRGAAQALIRKRADGLTAPMDLLSEHSLELPDLLLDFAKALFCFTFCL